MKKCKVIASFSAGDTVYNPGDEISAADGTAEAWAKMELVELPAAKPKKPASKGAK